MFDVVVLSGHGVVEGDAFVEEGGYFFEGLGGLNGYSVGMCVVVVEVEVGCLQGSEVFVRVNADCMQVELARESCKRLPSILTQGKAIIIRLELGCHLLTHELEPVSEVLDLFDLAKGEAFLA